MNKTLIKLQWHTEKRKVGALVPFEKNPRKLSKEQETQLKQSLEKFNLVEIPAVDTDGKIVAGHQRVAVLKLLGRAEEMIEVRIPNRKLAAAEFKEYNLRSNKNTGDWDFSLLAEFGSGLLADVGFSENDLASILGKMDMSQLLDNDRMDDVPPVPAKAATKTGDIWILGNHRLLCGDSAKPEDVDRLLAGAKIHLINTDPPYNVNVAPRSNAAVAMAMSQGKFKGQQEMDAAKRGGAWGRDWSKKGNGVKELRAKDRPLANDFLDDKRFAELLRAWFGNIVRVLEPGRSYYIWGGYSNIWNYPAALKACELHFSQMIIWVKEHPVLTRKDFMGNHEWCFYGWKEGAPHHFYGPNNTTDVWSVKKVNPQSMVHLTEKPAELAIRAITYSTKQCENVLDLFGGSGSTMIACEQTGRKAFLMELDPLYCDVIVKRYEQFTGKKAVQK
ncbi:MAG: DNA methyltransferase [Elusimicrobiales bacterium]|nr:DNA methyltransferase [Elusimicrobiales bacterium]